MKPGVYILQSNKNCRYYIGSTNDISKRVIYHNSGRVFSTKNLRPWELRIFIECENITIAKSNEFRLKKYKRRDIVEKVIEDGLFPWEYSERN